MVAVLAMVLAACGGSAGSSTATTGRGSTSSTTALQGSAATSSTSIMAAVRSARWAPNVTVGLSGTSITISSDGLPSTTYWTRPADYALPDTGVVVPTAATAHVGTDPTVASAVSLTVPGVPVWSTTTTATSLGPIGIMVSGAVLFNPYEGNASTVALSSNFSVTNSAGVTASFVDGCNGHPTPTGEYHYHGIPTCITDKVDGSTGPSHLIGVAFDGYPIYGDRDIHGHLVQPSQLDACNGIYSATPEFPHGIYHYVLPDVTDVRSSITCFHGVVDRTLAQISAGAAACGALADTDHLTAATRPSTRKPASVVPGHSTSDVTRRRSDVPAALR
jgi:hypothetical protein